MSQISFKVSISPDEALERVKEKIRVDSIYEEKHDLTDGKLIGSIVFEKYFLRTSNRAALVVYVDNIQGTTEVRAVATGTSQSMLFKFDWGAADDFVYSVRDILEEYVVE